MLLEHRDYPLAEAVKGYPVGLSFDPDTLPLPIGHFIGGRLIPAEGVIEMRRPSDGKLHAGGPIAGKDIVDEAVVTAKKALKASNWGGVRPRERTKVMHAWADGQTTGDAITGHPEIAKVSFTGSNRAGAAIAENIARTGIKPMTLELGGKSPQIVFADADLARTWPHHAGDRRDYCPRHRRGPWKRQDGGDHGRRPLGTILNKRT
jgi:hypothetical protein